MIVSVTKYVRTLAARVIPLACAAAVIFAPDVAGAVQRKRHPVRRHHAVRTIPKTPPVLVQNYTPKPAIWKLADADTTIYLFGTTHILRPGFKWRTPALDDIINTADELVLESIESEGEDKNVRAQFQQMMHKGADQRKPILTRVSLNKRPALRRAAAKMRVPLAFFSQMPTWMVTFSLSYGDMQSGGASGALGVEAALEKAFRTKKRKISAVENSQTVLNGLSDVPEAAQVKMLEDALDEIETGAGNDAQSDDNWAQGKVELLDKEFTREELGDDVYDVLIKRRNTAWTLWLNKRLDTPGTVLFAVGAGHLAGPDSLQKMLADKDLTAQRIQ